MTMKFEVFRSGTQKSSNGIEKNWTNSDLDSIALKYNESNHEAPIVIGHPKSNGPAWGWIGKLSRVGNVLFAEASEVVEEFKTAFNKGMYKKRSIAFYEDLTLKHIGFLGAQPPAVKGLADFKFEEAKENLTFEFEDSEHSESNDREVQYSINTIGRTIRGLREWLISLGHKEAANDIADNYAVKTLENFDIKKNERETLGSLFSEGKNKMKTVEQLQTENDELKAKVLAFSESEKAKDLQISTLEKSIKDEEEKGIKEFCEGLVSEGRLPKANLEAEISKLNMIKAAESGLNFAENETSIFEQHKKTLAENKPSVEFEEFAKKEKASSKDPKIEKEIEDLSKSGEFSEEVSEEFRLISKIQKDEGISFNEAASKHYNS